MLIIKNLQIDIFKGEALKKFEDDMVDHIRDFFPNHFNAMQENNVRATIQYGYLKAKTYGFVTIRNVCLYLNNMLLLGSNFDCDPQYPLAAEILNDGNEKDAALKIDKLSGKTQELLKQVSGPNNIFIYRAILNFTHNAHEIFQQLNESDLSKALSHFKMIFKQKYEFVGEANLQQMVKYGIGHAKRYEITSGSNLLVYLIFMFMMGSGFDKDPQFPWAAEILINSAPGNPDKKMEALYFAAIEHLTNALSEYKN